MAELTDTDIRERVRERYAAAATAVAESTGVRLLRSTGRHRWLRTGHLLRPTSTATRSSAQPSTTTRATPR